VFLQNYISSIKQFTVHGYDTNEVTYLTSNNKLHNASGNWEVPNVLTYSYNFNTGDYTRNFLFYFRYDTMKLYLHGKDIKKEFSEKGLRSFENHLNE